MPRVQAAEYLMTTHLEIIGNSVEYSRDDVKSMLHSFEESAAIERRRAPAMTHDMIRAMGIEVEYVQASS